MDKQFTERQPIELTFAKWKEQFNPISCPLHVFACFDGFLWDTHDKLPQRGPGHYWTYIQDESDLCIVDGWRLFNRLGYLVTEVAYEEDVDYVVALNE